MIHYPVPFYSNTSDNTHCFQASMKSVLKYFLPEKEFSFKKLDEMSGKEEGMWTWAQRMKINMLRMGFEIKEIEDWDIDEFVRTGKKYLIKKYGKEVADKQEKHGNLAQARADYAEYGKYKIVENRIPTIKDIKSLLNKRYLVCCNINSKALNKKDGYTGHFVTVIGYDEKNLILHNPGLPPQKKQIVSFKDFIYAWAFPDKYAQNITAFKI